MEESWYLPCPFAPSFILFLQKSQEIPFEVLGFLSQEVQEAVNVNRLEKYERFRKRGGPSGRSDAIWVDTGTREEKSPSSYPVTLSASNQHRETSVLTTPLPGC